MPRTSADNPAEFCHGLLDSCAELEIAPCDFARSFIQTGCLNERPATLAITLMSRLIRIDRMFEQAGKDPHRLTVRLDNEASPYVQSKKLDPIRTKR